MAPVSNTSQLPHKPQIVTCTAPVNIAVVKYWGKRNEKLILPTNDSVSITLSSNQMHAKTSVSASPNFIDGDKIWLNGKEESISGNARLINCLREVRARARSLLATKNEENIESKREMLDWNVHICSENNFPTAAGLASSAAGYACLVYSLCKLYGIPDGEDMSKLARQGSGSACRSVYGGFVRWRMGNLNDGSDSRAEIVEPASHWPNMHALILVASDGRKKVPSTVGMRRSVETSHLFKIRANDIVPERTEQMVKAIREKDFDTFASLTMRDSDNMHAVCLDTYPPCVYMNDVSHAAVSLIHKINEVCGGSVERNDDSKMIACYTFDAGPNACIFLRDEHVGLVAGLINHFFPPPTAPVITQSESTGESGIGNEASYIRGEKFQMILPDPTMLKKFEGTVPAAPGSLKYVIHTCIGNGPETLADEKSHLLDINTGYPNFHSK